MIDFIHILSNIIIYYNAFVVWITPIATYLVLLIEYIFGREVLIFHLLSNLINNCKVIFYLVALIKIYLNGHVFSRLTFVININYDDLADLVTFINTILTLSIGYVFSRQAFVRWRKSLFNYFIFIWLFFIIISFKKMFNLEIPIMFLVFLLFLWLCVFCQIVKIFHNILNLELIQFSELKLEGIKTVYDPLESENCRFESECIDDAINDATLEKRKLNKELQLYPLIIAADECWRPWNIAQKFVVKAILEKGYKTGVIYFTFVRPHKHIIKGLKRKKIKITGVEEIEEDFFNNTVIIDCFSFISLNYPEKKTINKKGNNYKYLIEDPRNPHSLNKCYEEALRYLSNDQNCTRICVVYDALSDFLSFTDEQIAIQYLRHNMFLEEINNISSVYIYRLNILQNKFFDEYLTWFANCVLYFESKDGKPIMRSRGLFSDPKCYDIDYNLCRKRDFFIGKKR